MLNRNQRIDVIPIVHHCNSVFTKTMKEDETDVGENTYGKFYQKYEFENERLEDSNTVYQVPYIFEQNGRPWVEANLFLFSLAKVNILTNSPNDKLRRMAWTLLDYKVFCEEHSIDLYDFSGLRPISRPTYRYFKSLLDRENLNGRTLNQKTKVIYDFYNYVHAKGKYNFDFQRVDVTRSINITIGSRNGFISKEVLKRSQTVAVPPRNQVAIGFVRDEGEDLRPLASDEYQALIKILEGETLKLDQKLIVLLALFTGERKQTILTLRTSHLKQFNRTNLGNDGLYRIRIGPSNGADTKFNKPHLLLISELLAEMLIRYSKSNFYKKRAIKFSEKHSRTIADDDIYLFLTREGNCHYMAKNDPQYLKIRTRPTGGNTKTITKIIISASGGVISKEFTFHWLRATFAYQYYISIIPLINEGKIKNGEDINIIQKRLHHSHRETTENYLKLFTTIDERLTAQKFYEGVIFGTSSSLLKVVDVENSYDYK